MQRCPFPSELTFAPSVATRVHNETGCVQKLVVRMERLEGRNPFSLDGMGRLASKEHDPQDQWQQSGNIHVEVVVTIWYDHVACIESAVG